MPLLLLLLQVTHFTWHGQRRGMLFNDVVAIRHTCSNPDSVIVTLDADDMLLRHDALSNVMAAHKVRWVWAGRGSEPSAFACSVPAVTPALPDRAHQFFCQA